MNVEALVVAVLISIGSNLLIAAVVYFVANKRGSWGRTKPVLIAGAIGSGILMALAIYYLWPPLHAVPALGLLSRDEAERVLIDNKLIPDARPQYSDGVEADRVIPDSQNLKPGLKVQTDTVVSFSVSVRNPTGGGKQAILEPAHRFRVALTQPKSGGTLVCSRGADGTSRCVVSGLSEGIDTGDGSLLLWLKPVSPPAEAPGWYLQRPPLNGISRIEADGSWIGLVQVGNAQYPPRDGDEVAIGVTAILTKAAQELLMQPGVVIRPQPVGTPSELAPRVKLTFR